MTAAFLERYGNPDVNGDGILDLEWAKENLAVFNLPFPLVVAWQPEQIITRFQAHRLAGDKIIAALETMLTEADKLAIQENPLAEAERPGLEYLRAHKLNRWGGCFNFRLVRGGHTLSNHAWGTAVDINPDIGRMGSFDDLRTYPRWIVGAFESAGFYWGGHFARPDPMHFELQS